MTKVTSKLQVTIPKALARQYGIKPGDEIEFRPAGTEIRVVPPRVEHKRLSLAERVRLFRAARARQLEREQSMSIAERAAGDRGWTREGLYTRGKPAEGNRQDSGSRGDG